MDSAGGTWLRVRVPQAAHGSVGLRRRCAMHARAMQAALPLTPTLTLTRTLTLTLTRLLASCFDDHPSLLVLLHSSRRVLTRCLYPEVGGASAYLEELTLTLTLTLTRSGAPRPTLEPHSRTRCSARCVTCTYC